MSETEKMILELKQNDTGENEIWLDGNKLRHVINYKIESTNPLAGVMLSLEMLVKFPERKNAESEKIYRNRIKKV